MPSTGTEATRGRTPLRVLLFVPNLIGYVRLCLIRAWRA